MSCFDVDKSFTKWPILDSILLGQTPPYIKNHQHPDQETDEETQDLLDQAEEDMEK